MAIARARNWQRDNGAVGDEMKKTAICLALLLSGGLGRGAIAQDDLQSKIINVSTDVKGWGPHVQFIKDPTVEGGAAWRITATGKESAQWETKV